MRKQSLKSIYKLSKKNNKIVFIGSDLGSGILNEMKEKYPNRFFMEGVSEQHILGMAAGLAMDGFIPFVNTISTFFYRRALDQIIIDLCLHDLPVRLIANGGGLVYAPLGPTHIAFEDISILRPIPNLGIFTPADAIEMQNLIKNLEVWPHPAYIRLGKGGDPTLISKIKTSFQIGRPRILKESKKNLILSCGIMSGICQDALKNVSNDHDIGHIHFHTIKPLDKKYLKRILKGVENIITFEENTLTGGFGSMILEFLNENLPDQNTRIKRFGLGDVFPKHYGSQATHLNYWGLSSVLIYKKIMKLFA